MATRWILLGLLFVVGRAEALERFVPDDQLDSWNHGASCVISYWNVCNDLIWVFTAPDFPHAGYVEEGEVWGVLQEGCGPGVLEYCELWGAGGTTSGYGYSSVLSVHASDQDGQPSVPPLASQAIGGWGMWQGGYWKQFIWSLEVPERYWIVLTHHGMPTGYGTPPSIATERGLGSDEIPAACGLCYPVDRPPHTFDFGVGFAITPGVPLQRLGGCAIELIMRTSLTPQPTATSPDTWGGIKALYR